MKYYENKSQPQDRNHVVEVILQTWEFYGTFSFSIGWNTLGLDVLTTADGIGDYITDLINNDVNMNFDEDWVTYTLHDDKHNSLECEEEIDDMFHKIVKLEIIECKVK